MKLVHTHDGAAAVAMALAYGTPKDRKRLVKGMKGGRACRRGSSGDVADESRPTNGFLWLAQECINSMVASMLSTRSV